MATPASGVTGITKSTSPPSLTPGPLEAASGVGLTWQVTTTGDPAFVQFTGNVPASQPAGSVSTAVELSVPVVAAEPKFLAVSVRFLNWPWLVHAESGWTSPT